MNKLKNKINVKNAKTISDYISLSAQIEKDFGENRSATPKSIRIGFLSSFTTKGIQEVLHVQCFGLGAQIHFFESAYKQYAQEILNKRSNLYKFNPNLIILFIDIASLLSNLACSLHQQSELARKKWVNEQINELDAFVSALKSNSDAQIILHNFETPSHSALGILENKQPFGIIESIEHLNAKLRHRFKLDSRVFLFDYNSFLSNIGKQHARDEKMYYLGDIKLNWNHMPALGNAYLSYIKPMLSLNRKCLVVDLDNTLWGGIVGEDPMEDLKLGPTPEGRPFLELQQYLLSLYHRGIILAINSRNNPSDALKVLRTHPHMVLKEKHFSSIQLNWNDKASNLRSIAKELNIGLDSIAMLDDDPFMRDLVRSTLPDVLIIDLPPDPARYLSSIMKLNDFNTLQLTNEDKVKGEIYAAERKRKVVKLKALDLTTYLKALQTKVTIEKASKRNFPRIAQLTQKTNQFNMTTRRYQESDIKRFSDSPNYLVCSVKAKDKFGDYGIIGAAIVEKKKELWQIDTFLMSCRALGRHIEQALLYYLIQSAKARKVPYLRGEFVPTSKNELAKHFYRDNGFLPKKNEDTVQYFHFDLSNKYKKTEHMKVTLPKA
jgi:FkbH-like protein